MLLLAYSGVTLRVLYITVEGCLGLRWRQTLGIESVLRVILEEYPRVIEVSMGCSEPHF